MARKHNTRHSERGNSNYPARLRKRGLKSATVTMDDLDTLRHRQRARPAEGVSPIVELAWAGETGGDDDGE